MTKDKLKRIIKRLSYILTMLKEGKEEKYVYIGHRKERIEIDGDVKAVIKIIEEIIENEKTEWLKELLTDIKEGWKDYKIVIQFPIERSKYYQIKERFVNKIYQCCIYRGLVEYQDILDEEIG